ncbi:MAG: TatD family hydrolase [Lachnospiraceae bacterium]|nr:TatD family hydrolase [Lachnospiraceae bacterium]
MIDTHVHYDDEAFDSDRESLLASLAEAGVGRVIDIASSAESLDKVMELTRRCPFVYGALGLHPDSAGELTDEALHKIEEGLCDPKIVAVGEIGLDYYWNKEAKELQIDVFRRQIETALRCGKPIAIHSREAAEDTLKVLMDYYGRGGPGEKLERKGVMHCYSYSPELAEIYTRKLGFFLGIGGVVTFKNAKKLVETVKRIPLSFLLLETDCPYLAPVPFRGKRNSSLHLHLAAEKIAEIKGISAEEVMRATEENAKKLFWPEK